MDDVNVIRAGAVLGGASVAVGCFFALGLLLSSPNLFSVLPPDSAWLLIAVIAMDVVFASLALYAGLRLLRRTTTANVRLAAVSMVVLVVPMVHGALDEHLIAALSVLGNFAYSIDIFILLVSAVLFYVLLGTAVTGRDGVSDAGIKLFYGRPAAFLLALGAANVAAAFFRQYLDSLTQSPGGQLLSFSPLLVGIAVYAMSLRLVHGGRPPSPHVPFRLRRDGQDEPPSNE